MRFDHDATRPYLMYIVGKATPMLCKQKKAELIGATAGARRVVKDSGTWPASDCVEWLGGSFNT